MDQRIEPSANEIEKKSQDQPEPQKHRLHKWLDILKTNWTLKGALILMLLLAGMYGWKNLAVRKVEKETLQQSAKVTETADQLLLQKNRALLRLTAMPLSWVVRMEMARGNYDNIDQYFKQIIKEDRFRVILLAGTDGKIMVATDKRMEGADLSQYFDPSLLDRCEITVDQLKGNELIVAAPVMGLTAKMGVLIMVYPSEDPGGKKKTS